MTDSLSSSKKPKVLYIEILRIIAIFFVIFNHTNQRGYTHFTLFQIGTFKYWFCMFFSALAGINVPIFFMISGMFLLGKQNESIGYIWKKRIPKYIIILFVLSFIHYFRIIKFDINAISIKDYLTRVYSSGVIIPYWFLYSYIAFLIGLPFIRKMARDFTEKEFLYLTGIYLTFNGVLSIIQYRVSNGTLWFNGSLNPTFLTGSSIVFYPLIGYYIGTKLKKIDTKHLLIAFVLFIISIATTLYITNYKILITGDLGEGAIGSFYGSSKPLQAIFVFLLIRKIFENKKAPVVIEKVLVNLGGCVFGIYLIEQILREELYFIYDRMCTKINDFLAIFIYVLLILCICWAIVAAYKFVAFLLRKLLSLLFRKSDKVQ